MSNKTTVYWLSDKDLHIETNGNTERINAEAALEKYKDNNEVMAQITNLMEVKAKHLFMASSIGPIWASVKSQPASLFNDKNPITSDKKAAFIAIYTKLANELTYDEEYAGAQKTQDKQQGLSAYEMRLKDIERTHKDKRGVCTTFSMRLNEELNNLGIENKFLITQSREGNIHWCVAYNDNGQVLVADITKDIMYADMLGVQKGIIPAISAAIPLSEYLQDPTLDKVISLENIKNDGKKFEELEATPILKIDAGPQAFSPLAILEVLKKQGKDGQAQGNGKPPTR
ncbi:MAG: hypothetical protein LBL34_01545 [Clostridiales bacterium]|jgi:hypothetical protein|nr:hypothetical protein [Clostridiales bacterium]